MTYMVAYQEHAPTASATAMLYWLADSSKQHMQCCRFTLELDAMNWHLCQRERTPFVDASIAGVMLDSIQNKDLSGGHTFSK